MSSSSRSPEWRLHVDPMSQPSRCCLIFARCCALPVEERLVRIHKGEQRDAGFTASVNPLAKLPALEKLGGGDQPPFTLPESAAIVALLADVHGVPEHWMPRSDRLQRARVEAALHWYHATIRAGCARLLFNRVLASKLGVPGNEAVAADAVVILKRALNDLESVWLGGGGGGGGRAFVGGGDAPSVADLLLACELEQLTMLNKERHGLDMAELLAKHPGVRAWMQAVARATAPHYEQVHALLRRAAAAGGGTRSPTQDLTDAPPRSKL